MLSADAGEDLPTVSRNGTPEKDAPGVWLRGEERSGPCLCPEPGIGAGRSLRRGRQAVRLRRGARRLSAGRRPPADRHPISHRMH